MNARSLIQTLFRGCRRPADQRRLFALVNSEACGSPLPGGVEDPPPMLLQEPFLRQVPPECPAIIVGRC